ncbi:cytochrome P450 [Pseudonocardia kujensis]|uniref:cytochrome P450 n=1 Tax=Pseudonocardia kujensis TaxID=1128675 RepID=UPI001E532A4E|nr:cytochrome P450 [Pseudonocardia kujensis]MCE0767899.1 cytochrome P450 [Pseudonocardia kujensis]
MTTQQTPLDDPPDRTGEPGLPLASGRDTLRAAGAILPIIAQGVIARRRRVVALAGKADLDGRGVRILQDLSTRYGRGPVRLRLPGRRAALVLDGDDVRRILDGTPEPFAPDTWEKRKALGQFQPHGVLVSHGAVRAERRRFNEAVLDSGHPLHHNAAVMARAVAQEAAVLGAEVDRTGELDWDAFIRAWWRVLRRVVLGDAARDDHALTDELTRLRDAANWSFLLPRRRARRSRFRARVREHLRRAEPGSLAEMIARTPAEREVDAVDQVPQWLFAYDPAGAVALRALAALVAHPAELARAREEIGDRDLALPQDLPRLRAAVLESVRLWPTTPLLLRETTQVVPWNGGELDRRTALIIPTWYLHRDGRTRADANRFDPQQWLDGAAQEDPALVPFSAGPGRCPGRELVLFTTSLFLANLLRGRELELAAPVIDPQAPLPAGVDPFAVRLRVRPTG